jgi:hypothetical protein
MESLHKYLVGSLIRLHPGGNKNRAVAVDDAQPRIIEWDLKMRPQGNYFLVIFDDRQARGGQMAMASSAMCPLPENTHAVRKVFRGYRSSDFWVMEVFRSRMRRGHKWAGWMRSKTPSACIDAGTITNCAEAWPKERWSISGSSNRIGSCLTVIRQICISALQLTADCRVRRLSLNQIARGQHESYP